VLVGEGIYDLGLLTPYPGLFPLHRVRVHTAFGHCFFNACLPFSAVNKERHFSCEDCNGNVSGGFDASTSQIVLCQNNIRNQAHMNRVVTHELVHAFDHCRAHVNWFTDVRHLACSEVRAANLSGDCSLVNEIFRLHFGLKQHHQVKLTYEIPHPS